MGSLWNGIGPSQTAQSPLHLRISDGDLTSVLGKFVFEAVTVALTPSTTNYVFLDLTQSPPVVVVNTSRFPSTACYTIAQVTTNATRITAMTDSRPLTFNPKLGGGSAAGAQGDVQFNSGGAFADADTVAPGCSVNLDTNIGSGLAVTIVNGGVNFQSDLGFGVVALAAEF